MLPGISVQCKAHVQICTVNYFSVNMCHVSKAEQTTPRTEGKEELAYEQEDDMAV